MEGASASKLISEAMMNVNVAMLTAFNKVSKMTSL
jgi:hypothetical protein